MNTLKETDILTMTFDKNVIDTDVCRVPTLQDLAHDDDLNELFNSPM